MSEPASFVPWATVTSGEDPRGDVGVLLVHGIGEHGEADTLLSFGEPLIDWLREWLAGPAGGIPRKDAMPRGRVDVPTGRTRAQRNEAESPAYACVNITAFGPPQDDLPDSKRSERKEQWLFAEAWWGNSVQVPAALQLLIWMLLRAPLLVYWHFHGGTRLEQTTNLSGPLAAVTALLRAVMSCATALALQVAILVGIVLWTIPIGPWRQALLATVRKIAAILGDSFVLLEHDIQRAALVQRVRSSLGWLQARTNRLWVIAHSQGAAIAHEAIQASPFPKICGFISVGSGLEKLELLRLVRSDRRGVWSAHLLGLSALGLVLVVLQPLVHWTSEPGWAWVGAALLMLIIMGAAGANLVDAMKHYHSALASRLRDFRLQTSAGKISWSDIRAEMDVVPMGANSQLAQCDFVKQIRVTNEASVVGDHVRYFETRCDFTPRCWALLSGCSEVVRFTDKDEEQLDRLRGWHRTRAIGLVGGQCLNPLTAVVAALLASSAVRTIGESLMSFLDEAKLNWPHRLLDWSSQRLAGGVDWLFHPQMTVPELAHTVVGALAVLVGLVGWWMLGTGLWRASNQRLARQVARGDRFRQPGWQSFVPGGIGVAFWTVAAMLPLLSFVLAYFTLQETTVGGLFRAAAMLVSGLFWMFGVLFSFAIPLSGLRRPDPGGRLEPDVHLGLLVFSLFGGPLYGLFGYWLWQAGDGPVLGQAWLPGLLAVWGGVIATCTLFNRQIEFRPVERWGVMLLYVACLAAGWVYLSENFPSWWPLIALAAAAGNTLAAGFFGAARNLTKDKTEA